MSNHAVKYLAIGETKHVAVCSCRWRSKDMLTLQAAEDAAYAHGQIVERVRTHLSTKTPSLKSQRDYYATMAEAGDTPDGDRPIWRQLRDELDHRLNDSGGVDEDQLRLL